MRINVKGILAQGLKTEKQIVRQRGSPTRQVVNQVANLKILQDATAEV